MLIDCHNHIGADLLFYLHGDFPYAQQPDATFVLVVKTDGDPAAPAVAGSAPTATRTSPAAIAAIQRDVFLRALTFYLRGSSWFAAGSSCAISLACSSCSSSLLAGRTCRPS